jgi:hypothetical protein
MWRVPSGGAISSVDRRSASEGFAPMRRDSAGARLDSLIWASGACCAASLV